MALTLGQLDIARRHSIRLQERLAEMRRQIESKILNLEPTWPHHSREEWRERHQLINQLTHSLVRMEQQHQQIETTSRTKIAELQVRLLESWNRFVVLQEDDGDSKAVGET